MDAISIQNTFITFDTSVPGYRKLKHTLITLIYIVIFITI